MEVAALPMDVLAQEQLQSEEQAGNIIKIEHTDNQRVTWNNALESIENPKIHHMNIKIATINAQGMAEIADRQRLQYLADKHEIDVMGVEESHVSYTGKEETNNYVTYFTSNKTDADKREVQEKLTALRNNNISFKKMTEVQRKEYIAKRMRIISNGNEKHGVALMIRKQGKLGKICWE